jgi:hypothetical protein
VCSRWFGMSSTLARLRDVLNRPPEHSVLGKDCWSNITVAQGSSIAEASYAQGATPSEIAALAAQFPPSSFWWMIERDY